MKLGRDGSTLPGSAGPLQQLPRRRRPGATRGRRSPVRDRLVGALEALRPRPSGRTPAPALHRRDARPGAAGGSWIRPATRSTSPCLATRSRTRTWRACSPTCAGWRRTSTPASRRDTLRIGTVLPTSGALADVGLPMRAVLSGWFDALNRRGGDPRPEGGARGGRIRLRPGGRHGSRPGAPPGRTGLRARLRALPLRRAGGGRPRGARHASPWSGPSASSPGGTSKAPGSSTPPAGSGSRPGRSRPSRCASSGRAPGASPWSTRRRRPTPRPRGRPRRSSARGAPLLPRCSRSPPIRRRSRRRLGKGDLRRGPRPRRSTDRWMRSSGRCRPPVGTRRCSPRGRWPAGPQRRWPGATPARCSSPSRARRPTSPRPPPRSWPGCARRRARRGARAPPRPRPSWTRWCWWRGSSGPGARSAARSSS